MGRRLRRRESAIGMTSTTLGVPIAPAPVRRSAGQEAEPPTRSGIRSDYRTALETRPGGRRFPTGKSAFIGQKRLRSRFRKSLESKH